MKEKIVSVWTAITLALIVAVLFLLGLCVSRVFTAAIVVTLMPSGAIFLWRVISKKLEATLKSGGKK